MAIDVSADVTADTQAETESGKQFYWTAFCTGAESVSGRPTQ